MKRSHSFDPDTTQRNGRNVNDKVTKTLDKTRIIYNKPEALIADLKKWKAAKEAKAARGHAPSRSSSSRRKSVQKEAEIQLGPCAPAKLEYEYFQSQEFELQTVPASSLPRCEEESLDLSKFESNLDVRSHDSNDVAANDLANSINNMCAQDSASPSLGQPSCTTSHDPIEYHCKNTTKSDATHGDDIVFDRGHDNEGHREWDEYMLDGTDDSGTLEFAQPVEPPSIVPAGHALCEGRVLPQINVDLLNLLDLDAD